MPRIRQTKINIAGLQAIKIGAKSRFGNDGYYRLLIMKWRYFIPLVFAVYFLINIVFTSLYMLQADSVRGAANGSFSDHFFFSVETLATVGYGVTSPNTFYGHIVSTIEIFMGMFLTASITALAFARFAKPRAKLMFSTVATITPHEGGHMAVTIRVANRRHHLMADVTARVAVWVTQESKGALRSRGLEDLKLVRSSTPVLGLFWPLVHVIDEASPFHGRANPDALSALELRMIVSVSGMDDALSATVGSRKTYFVNDFRWQAFVPIIDETADGTPRIDLTRLSETEK